MTHAAEKKSWPERAAELGESAYANIRELVEATRRECPACEGSGTCSECGGDGCDKCDVDGDGDCAVCEGVGERDQDEIDEARQAIDEDPLSVQVRSGWYTPGGDSSPEEYEILLSTGGPASRIIGELDAYGEPTSARLQVQDWFEPWTEYFDADQDVLLEYARCFYYGEG